MAGTTGLEPAASAVTGQRSNQLNYVPNLILIVSNVFSGACAFLSFSKKLPRLFERLAESRLVAPMSGNSFSVYDEVVALETPNGPITPDTSLPCGFRQQ